MEFGKTVSIADGDIFHIDIKLSIERKITPGKGFLLEEKKQLFEVKHRELTQKILGTFFKVYRTLDYRS